MKNPVLKRWVVLHNADTVFINFQINFLKIFCGKVRRMYILGATKEKFKNI